MTEQDERDARELAARIKPTKLEDFELLSKSGLELEAWTIALYAEDIAILQTKYGDKWPVFIRDIINQHTTPYGAPRVKVLTDLATEYKTVKS